LSGAVAVGVFDGVHLGHRALLERALERAQGERTVALSFEPHPDVVLAREFRPYAPLTPLPEKHVRIERMGVELRVLPFTRELAALEPEVFVERHLVSPFALRWLVVGEDFALGRARSGNLARLRELGQRHGFEVDALPLLVADGAPVTSTRIRALAGRRPCGRGRATARPSVWLHRAHRGRRPARAHARLPDREPAAARRATGTRHGIYAVWARLSASASGAWGR
jgi:riboflavin kinase/FMN adenylyltransferase